MQPLILLNAVGLTHRLLPHAPRLQALAAAGWSRPLEEVLPAVTCTAQATLLTGKLPRDHGVVANGWLYRDTREIRFWQQSNALLQAEPFYVTAKRRAAEQGRSLKVAKLFWWFNQGAAVDISLTPKPHYGADGNKAFDITGTPEELPTRGTKALGPFPFPSFWGPRAGLPATQWIARAAAFVQEHERPDLSLVYLPHLDYDPQRFGPSGCDMPRLVRELDDACEPILEAAKEQGARVWVVSEYGHCDVAGVMFPNRVLRAGGFLEVRPGPFGELLDTFNSRAFAVCDHQLAHIYVKDPLDISPVRDLVAQIPSVGPLYSSEERAEIGLDHPRSGEIIALAKPNAWFAYPYWLDDRLAPDFARTVDIHRKPGFDPNELFVDPKIKLPALRIARRLLQKKLGFRTLFDVIPIDTFPVRGSHGLTAPDPQDKPLLIGDANSSLGSITRLTDVRDVLLNSMM